jgi:hypothetical protein
VETLDPSKVGLSSQYQRGQDPIPANYRLLRHLPLTNPYWWPRSEYGYYVFANEKAPRDLTTVIETAPVDPDALLGYQRHVLRIVNALRLGWSAVSRRISPQSAPPSNRSRPSA